MNNEGKNEERNPSPIEHALVRSTIRILAGMEGKYPFSIGTGLFYKVVHAETNIAKTLILTNKHVIAGAEVVHFVLSSAPSIDSLDEHHQPIGRTDQLITWALPHNTYMHPDPKVDLCGIDITFVIAPILEKRQLRAMFIDSSWLPSQADKRNLRDIQQVLVIGYPRGIWDEFNNMPIARVGTTATHPIARYQGKPDFLVDVAAFSGSSGSPVFSYEAPMFRTAKGSFTPGTKVQFIGLIWGVIESTTAGELKFIDIPSAVKQVPVINTSLNLAIALQAQEVLTLDRIVFSGASGNLNSST